MAAAMITAVALVVVLSVVAAHHIGVIGQRSGSQRLCRLVRVAGYTAIQLDACRRQRRLCAAANASADQRVHMPVSYTHLTLPTILLV